MKRSITCWYSFDHKKNVFEFNHIEDGHSERDVPLAQHPHQVKSWKGQQWQKKHAYLEADAATVQLQGSNVQVILDKVVLI